MITRLVLSKFGKFADTSFAFSAVTVFFGRNEAGKTTIFDALFDNICAIKGNSADGGQLQARYGSRTGKNPERRATLEFSGEPFDFPADEFLRLYAVRCGDMGSSLSAGAGWINKIQNSLFTGGINPGTITGQLQKESQEKGSLSHMRQLADKKREREQKQKELRNKQDERSRILQEEKQLEQSDRQLGSTTNAIREAAATLHAIRETLDMQEKIAKQDELSDILAKLKRRQELYQWVKTLSAYREDRSGEAKKIIQTIADTERETDTLNAEIQTTARLLQGDEDIIRRLKTGLDARSRIILPLGGLLEQLDAERPRVVIRQIVTWNKVLLALAGALALAGTGAGIMLDFSVSGLIALCSGITLGLILLYAARKPLAVEEHPDPAPVLKKMLKRWQDISGGIPCPADTLDDLKEYLIRFKTDYERDCATLSERNETYNSAIAKLKPLEEKRDQKKKLHDESRQELSRWLGGMQASDMEDYTKKLHEYRHCAADKEAIEAELKRAMSSYQCDNAALLEAKATALLLGLQKETAGNERLPGHEIAGCKMKEKKLSDEITRLRNEEERLAKIVHRGSGKISGSLGAIPEAIHDLETQIMRLDREIRDLDLNRRAAGFAATIFAEMESDTAMQFDIISRDVAGRFSEFLPGIESIRIGSFNDNDILVADAGKVRRPPSQLSTGTRDAFWFAARLSLAFRAHGERPGIMVLDEPFHALDHERTGAAVSMLKRFRDDTGWQLVLFTKDESLAKKMEQSFGGSALVHRLS